MYSCFGMNVARLPDTFHKNIWPLDRFQHWEIRGCWTKKKRQSALPLTAARFLRIESSRELIVMLVYRLRCTKKVAMKAPRASTSTCGSGTAAALSAAPEPEVLPNRARQAV